MMLMFSVDDLLMFIIWRSIDFCCYALDTMRHSFMDLKRSQMGSIDSTAPATPHFCIINFHRFAAILSADRSPFDNFEYYPVAEIF